MEILAFCKLSKKKNELLMLCHIQVPVTECKKSIVAYDGIISIHWGLN